MKTLLQLTLFCIIVIISIFFYRNYFFEDKVVIKEDLKINDEFINSNNEKRNIIKNLKYEVTLKDNSKYIIKAESGKILFEDGVEVIFMENVDALFIDKNKRKLFVGSKSAKFNSDNYNTFFRDNVEINFGNKIITSKKLDFNFIDNNILIFENVRFSSPDKKIETDNIRIDTITKNVEIFMNQLNNNVMISSF